MKKLYKKLRLECQPCKKEYEITKKFFRCPHCNGPLKIKTIEHKKRKIKFLKGTKIYKYSHHLIPELMDTSLGEGNTPIIRSKKTKCFFKLEYLNPSGSFKDRGSATAISLVRSLNIKEVNEDSSGNAGASIALYSKAFGIKSNIYIPRDAPLYKKRIIKLFGGNLILCKNREQANIRAIEEANKKSIYYIGHLWNPFFILGLKTISYEILGDSIIPQHLFIPVGSGGLYLGIYQGFKDLFSEGIINHIPQIHVVEATGYERIYPKTKGKYRYPQQQKTKLADGIRVLNPPRLQEILDAKRESKGEVFVIDDLEIKKALRDLYKEGLIVEPTSASAYAAYKKALNTGYIKTDETTVIPLTGSGLKTIDRVFKILESKNDSS